MRQQGIDECSGIASRRRMNHHPGWFVDHNDITVFSKNMEGNVFGSDGQGLGAWDRSTDLIPGFKPYSWFGGSAVNQKPAFLDQLLNSRPGEWQVPLLEKTIETFASVLLQDLKSKSPFLHGGGQPYCPRACDSAWTTVGISSSCMVLRSKITSSLLIRLITGGSCRRNRAST